jgi:hypothetical protein
MRLLRYIDDKWTFREQYDYIKRASIILPFIIIIIEIIKYFIIKNYKFSPLYIIFSVFFNFIFYIPFIINSIKYNKKFKKIEKQILENYTTKLKTVKAKINYCSFIKNEVYELMVLKDTTTLTPSKWNIIFQLLRNSKTNTSYINKIIVFDSNDNAYLLKNIINKFELNDIKEERLKKLKRLNKLWKN